MRVYLSVSQCVCVQNPDILCTCPQTGAMIFGPCNACLAGGEPPSLTNLTLACDVLCESFSGATAQCVINPSCQHPTVRTFVLSLLCLTVQTPTLLQPGPDLLTCECKPSILTQFCVANCSAAQCNDLCLGATPLAASCLLNAGLCGFGVRCLLTCN